MLDERFRQRVDRLSRDLEGAGVELDIGARDRILDSIALQGPGLVRRARRTRAMIVAAGPLLACAAAVVLYMTRAEHARPSNQPTAVVGADNRALRACESRAPRAIGQNAFVLSGEQLRLELDPVATAVAKRGASVKLEAADRCETAIALTEGSVVVHARDLGGGTLIVHAGNTEVIVHGTIFAVTRTSESAVVEVVEGRVVVRRGGQEYTLSAGQRLTVSPIGVGTSRLDETAARLLREQLGPPTSNVVGIDSLPPAIGASRVAAGAVAPKERNNSVPGVATKLDETASDADILERAETARREARYADARTLYRQVGAGSGPTAEAAWLSLARMELGLGNLSAARDATEERRHRFGTGTLAPEAMWIDVRIDRQAGDVARARRTAEQIVQNWPTSPQAAAAKRWLVEAND